MSDLLSFFEDNWYSSGPISSVTGTPVLGEPETSMDTQHPQIKTEPSYRVRFYCDGEVSSTVHIGIALEEARSWTATRLREMEKTDPHGWWAAVIETGYLTGNPFDDDAPEIFLPDKGMKEGIVLDRAKLVDPVIDLEVMFGLKRNPMWSQR